jgi:hypothetical protein
MLGAIAGDVIGSTYEWNRVSSRDFPLFSPGSRFTDDFCFDARGGVGDSREWRWRSTGLSEARSRVCEVLAECWIRGEFPEGVSL